ncbi:MAG: site-specific integrase [Rhizobiales bacterium]|nr:site-specific integrase [Hyphomicrobiales bacterium]
MLFSNWWVNYARFQASADTMESRGKDMSAALGLETFIQDIDDEHMGDVVVDLFEGHRGERAPGTVNRIIDIFKKSLTIGKKNKLWKPKLNQFPVIDWEELRQEEPDERVVFLSEVEAFELIKEISNLKIKLAVAWSMCTGCRRNETATLKKNDFFEEARYCTVLAKGGKLRHVNLSMSAIKIAKYSMELNPNSEFIFDLTNRRKVWEDARENFGRPDLRWHDLRHVNGTWLRRFGGLDLKAVGKALGHSNLSSTNRYAHVADEELETAGDALPDLWKAFE